MKKIQTVILALFILAFIATGALLWKEHTDNNAYQTYLSDVLSNRVSSLISNITSVDRVLTEVINTQTINKNQASSLYGNFYSIKERNEEVTDIGIRLNKIQRNENDEVITTNGKLSEYFKIINDALTAEDIDQLTPAQLEAFTEYQSLVTLYKEIVKSNVLGVTDTGVNGEYWNNYFANGVEKDYWINLINDMENVTPEYKEFTLLN
jgi:hypothetical protein